MEKEETKEYCYTIALLLVALLYSILILGLTIKSLKKDNKTLRDEAIKYNYATYVPDSNGNVVFKWKESK